MKQPAIIVDINGCLGDVTNRKHFIENTSERNWPAFFEAMMTDTPIDMVHRFVNAQREWPFYNKVILITGAPEKYRPLMEEWLDKNQVQYDRLCMRSNGDFSSGVEFKRALFDREFSGEFNIALALDDKIECIKMYESLGIDCWLVVGVGLGQTVPKDFICHISEEEYFSKTYENTGYLSSSFLKCVFVGRSFSPYQSRAMKLGKLIHTRILEPDRFAIEMEGLDLGESRSIIENVLNRFPSKSLGNIQKGSCELSCFVSLPFGNVKVRFDSIDVENKIVYDLKTTSKYDDFQNQAINSHYDLQAALYLAAANKYWGGSFRFHWVVIETVYPYRVGEDYVKHDILEMGQAKIREAISRLSQNQPKNVNKKDEIETNHRMQRFERRRKDRGRRPRPR